MARQRRPQDPPPRENRSFTPVEAKQIKERMEKRLSELTALDRTDPAYARTAQIALDTTVTTVRDAFGERADEAVTFSVALMQAGDAITFSPFVEGPSLEQQEYSNATQRVAEAIARIPNLMSVVDEKTVAEAVAGRTIAAVAGSRRVFLVHGHSEEAKQAVARVLERLDLEPIILHEKPDMNRTIIEKFEAHADVGFAVVLMTPDDSGGPRAAKPDTYQPRARQNVVFEMGFFLGRLGRGRVCVLYDPAVEMPSDYSGVLYKRLNDPGWKWELAKEIDAAGIAVDLNRLK